MAKKKKAAKKKVAKKKIAARKPAKKAVRKPVKKKAKARRTTHRSSAGKKLYAVRDAEGQFKDIQTYQAAHSMDIARDAVGEQ